MSTDYALSVWRSVRATFILFLVVVPLVVFVNAGSEKRMSAGWDELVLPAAGLIGFAGLLAKAFRRMINFQAGDTICHWTSAP